MNEHIVIARGRTADILSLNSKQVLKLFKVGLPDQIIQEEFAISNGVYKLGVACPEPIKIIEYKDRKGIIYSRVHGMTVLDIITKKFWRMNKATIRLAQIHLNVHKHSISNIPKQKSKLIEFITKAPLLTYTEKKHILDRLQQLKDGTKLCHGDYHPDNVMLNEQNEWIIDWMTGMEGNPAGDVARTLLILKFGRLTEKAPKLRSHIVSQIRKYIAKKYIDEYLKNSEISKNEIDDWMLPVAAARLNESIPDEEKQDLVNLIREEIG